MSAVAVGCGPAEELREDPAWLRKDACKERLVEWCRFLQHAVFYVINALRNLLFEMLRRFSSVTYAYRSGILC